MLFWIVFNANNYNLPYRNNLEVLNNAIIIVKNMMFFDFIQRKINFNATILGQRSDC